MKITVLGSGTSSGVPYIGCTCAVCTSDNPKNKRLRSSCLFEVNGKILLIDSGPDLRQQALTHRIFHIDAVLYTHTHADHVHGIDELRVYNAYQKAVLPIYGDRATIAHIIEKFSYIFNPATAYKTFIPQLDPHIVENQFDCVGVPVQAIPCRHGPAGAMTQNYRIGNAAWLTDTNGIPDESYRLLENLDLLFIDGLRNAPHTTHFCLDETLREVEKIAAKQSYLIHLTHDYDHDRSNETLPNHVQLAYDGLEIVIPD